MRFVAVRFLAVLILVGATLVSGAPAGAQSPVPSPGPGTGGTTPGVLDWRPIAPPTLRPDRGMSDLVAWDHGFAMAEVGAKERTWAIWSSRDGTDWFRAGLPRPLGAVWSLAPWRGGLLLVADDPAKDQVLNGFDIQAWWSVDARHWVRLGGLGFTVPRVLAKTGCEVNHEHVLPMADRIVVLAAVCQDACCGTISPPDGAMAMLGPKRTTQVIGPSGPIAWTSRDGRHWTRRPVTGVDGYLETTARGADRVLAISGGVKPALLQSPDGLLWTPAGELPDGLDTSGQLLLAEAAGVPLIVGESLTDEGGYGNQMHLWRVPPDGAPTDVLQRRPAYTHSLMVDGDAVWLAGEGWGEGPSVDTAADDTAWAWLMGSIDAGATWPDTLAWTGSDGSCLGELAMHAGVAAMTACTPERLGGNDPGPDIPGVWRATTGTAAPTTSGGYWEEQAGGDFSIPGETLGSVLDASDLVVIARPIGLDPATPSGPDASPTDFDLLHLSIERVLKGHPDTVIPGIVDVRIYHPAGFTDDALRAMLPPGRVLLNLQNLVAYARRVGRPRAEIAAVRDQYGLINPSQGVLREIDGRVRTIDSGGPGVFPAPWEGRRFSDLVAAIVAHQR